MKKNLLLFYLLILSCSSPKNQEQIDVFEAKLGKENVEVLDLLVDDFEKNLNKQYPKLKLKDAYKKYLLDIKKYKTEDSSKFQFQTKITQTKFHESGLWNEIYKYDFQNSTNSDSTKYLVLNNLGKYMVSLDKVKNSDPLIKKFYIIREAAGIIQNEVFANGILSMNPDFDNYFHKRIVVIEFSF